MTVSLGNSYADGYMDWIASGVVGLTGLLRVGQIDGITLLALCVDLECHPHTDIPPLAHNYVTSACPFDGCGPMQ